MQERLASELQSKARLNRNGQAPQAAGTVDNPSSQSAHPSAPAELKQAQAKIKELEDQLGEAIAARKKAEEALSSAELEVEAGQACIAAIQDQLQGSTCGPQVGDDAGRVGPLPASPAAPHQTSPPPQRAPPTSRSLADAHVGPPSSQPGQPHEDSPGGRGQALTTRATAEEEGSLQKDLERALAEQRDRQAALEAAQAELGVWRERAAALEAAHVGTTSPPVLAADAAASLHVSPHGSVVRGRSPQAQHAAGALTTADPACDEEGIQGRAGGHPEPGCGSVLQDNPAQGRAEVQPGCGSVPLDNAAQALAAADAARNEALARAAAAEARARAADEAQAAAEAARAEAESLLRDANARLAANALAAEEAATLHRRRFADEVTQIQVCWRGPSWRFSQKQLVCNVFRLQNV
jgi:hypothetical protein